MDCEIDLEPTIQLFSIFKKIEAWCLLFVFFWNWSWKGLDVMERSLSKFVAFVVTYRARVSQSKFGSSNQENIVCLQIVEIATNPPNAPKCSNSSKEMQVYDYSTLFIMNKSKEIQEQYLNLRYKVEGKIKELEGKLSEPSTSNLLLNNNPSILPRQPHCHHNCHHPHHCHSTYNHNAQFFSHNNIELSQAENHNQSLGQSNSKNSSVNEMISSALVQSLKNQRQINDHIKAINEKIQTLSAQHNRSNLSQAFSESVSQNKIRVYPRPKKNQEEDKHRCLSEVKSESRPSLKTQPKRIKGVKLKKVKTKIKQNDYITSNKEKKTSRHNNSKSKSLAKNKSEYFLSFGCPIHSPSHQPAKSPSPKEIYKDSQFRNRKHEKNHLIESFKQQQKSRKRLISKIAHNAFSEYGRN